MGDMAKFKALVVEKTSDKQFVREIRERSVDDLPPGDLVIRVHYSSLNYKDALSATGHPGVTRQFPHTPGIDAAGEVVSCESGAFAPGDKVIVTGYDLGMETDGGWGQYVRIPSEWAVRLPEGVTLREAMALGTAGFTAALSVLKLERAGVRPADGDILVTGATGGVGSIAVSILAAAGYRVTAATGKEFDEDFLKGLGATAVIGRDDVTAGAEKALLAERWAGAVDVVGGQTLAAVLKSTKYGGTVTCCGLVGSPELPVNVYPFILRGVSLLGIDSVQCPRGLREEVWQRLATDWKPVQLGEMATECTLAGLEVMTQAILHGGITGRVVVNLLES
ncbi:YhdH/YhfP family quinone oxidoreductase [Geobacter hydrogenophilus]|uniref:Quinone oxidoreductase n=1 Tax=Geobacter hydrogenophilus TaxID=40983 RepID=A0A9W6G3Z5_9BACT|nr:YhdH/YhfP family quinone oxidoreductase [Geobacter hydrogenophilus]MBT0892688.1 YhdH/YhfP family quinone oxidoreductase [Geobacter hydrogenophilus]GLI40086.1 quinone oxidoreductase [Geobacter hydrogenophilus]